MGHETEREGERQAAEEGALSLASEMNCVGKVHSEHNVPPPRTAGIPGRRAGATVHPAGQAAPQRSCPGGPLGRARSTQTLPGRAGSTHWDEPRQAFPEDGFLPPPADSDTLSSALCAFRGEELNSA